MSILEIRIRRLLALAIFIIAGALLLYGMSLGGVT